MQCTTPITKINATFGYWFKHQKAMPFIQILQKLANADPPHAFMI